MWLRRPSDEEIARALDAADSDFSYPDVGATREPLDAPDTRLPAIYDRDVREFPLGEGQDLFERAREALFDWHHFRQVPWLTFFGGEARAETGNVVASLVSVFGVWFLNPCRVVYTEPPSDDHAAFAYGTLPGHAESGEERFSVRREAGTGTVVYRIEAFSRPVRWAPRLAYPFARRLQRRFAVASAEALLRGMHLPPVPGVGRDRMRP